MKIKFWGTRGSLPATFRPEKLRKKIKEALTIAAAKKIQPGTDIEEFINNELPPDLSLEYGTNTPSVEIFDEENFILCDAGSGLRDFGNHIMTIEDRPNEFHILMSHLHWDHIHGFPFFIPAFIPGNRITIYGCHKEKKKAFSVQQSGFFFPVDFNDLGADINFVDLIPQETYDINGFQVTPCEQNHPGKSYGYRIEKGGKTIIYSTDSEHKNKRKEDVEFFKSFLNNADLLIFDAQYTFADAITVKEDWGHSNNLVGIELALASKVKHICLFHHDPTSSDENLKSLFDNTQKLARLIGEDRKLEVSVARDGMTLTV